MNLEKEVKELRRIVIELRRTIHQQAIEIVRLRNEDEKNKERIAELEGKQEEKPKPDFIKDPVETTPKKTGQKNGHKGYSRYIPERIDEVKKLKLNECPDCGNKLSSTQEVRERIITDIQPIEAKNTKYRIPRKFCKNCNKIVEPEVKEALPNARFGLRLMLLVMFLKLGLLMPSKKIIKLMKLQYNLIISDGEVYGILNQLSEAFGSYYKELIQKMREAAVKHDDETSWRINGKNYWLWHFINKEVAIYIINKRRGSRVPINFLGNQEDKVHTVDRFSAYTKLAKETGALLQICWAHLLRKSRDLAENYKEAKYIHKRLKYIYGKAKEGVSKEKLLHWIDLIGSRDYKHSEVFKFVKSVCRTHRENLFRFVDNPKIESTNNAAERGLRHAVVMRKISNGSRSEKGAEVTGRLLSVIKSLELQNINPYVGAMDLLQKAK